MLRRETVGHLEQQRFAQQHRLGIAANIVVGVTDTFDALRRYEGWQRADARARLELAHGPRAEVDDLAAELVAEHDVAGEIHRLAAGLSRHLHHAVGVLARVQIGAADAAGERLDQHLAGAGLWLGHPVDDNLTVPENRSAHPAPPVLLEPSIARSGRAILRQGFGERSSRIRSWARRMRSRWAM